MESIGKILTIVVFMFFAHAAQCAHILGGHINYEVLEDLGGGMYNVEVELELFVEFSAASGMHAEDSVKIGLTESDSLNIEQSTQVFEFSLTNDFTPEQPSWSQCNTVGRRVYWQYTGIVAMNVNPDKYYTFNYLRCCRSTKIINVENPEENGSPINIRINGATIEQGARSYKLHSSTNFLFSSNQENIIEYSFQANEEVLLEPTIPQKIGGLDGVGGPATGDPSSCTGILPDPQLCPPPYAYTELKQGISSESLFWEGDYYNLNGNTVTIKPSLQGVYLVSYLFVKRKQGVVQYEQYYENVLEVTNCLLNNDAEPEADSDIAISVIEDQLFLHNSNEMYDYTIYGTDGRVIQSGDVWNGQLQLKETPRGIYILQLHNENRTSTVKFIKS